MWTSSREQFLSSELGPLVLERVFRRASLRNLVLEPSLLSLQQSTVFAARQVRSVTDQQVWDDVLVAVQGNLVIFSAKASMRATMWCGSSKLSMRAEAVSCMVLVIGLLHSRIFTSTHRQDISQLFGQRGRALDTANPAEAWEGHWVLLACGCSIVYNTWQSFERLLTIKHANLVLYHALSVGIK